MNLPSLILLLIIAGAVAFSIYKIRESKGACDDCDVATCPIHEREGHHYQ